MPTKRRQLPANDSPVVHDDIVTLAQRAAEYRQTGDHHNFGECVDTANNVLNRFERGFFAGYLAARRSP